ncbi:MAG: hypothetical protein K9K64_08510, partial [Desulfohalobiaceae bacterium]|nr:hypothetical protein [Desulfohalobiaceae bacterium]
GLTQNDTIEPLPLLVILNESSSEESLFFSRSAFLKTNEVSYEPCLWPQTPSLIKTETLSHPLRHSGEGRNPV